MSGGQQHPGPPRPREASILTVAALVPASGHRLSFLAGQAGESRPVTWAHAVDLPDPWRWVAAGDLLMTTGAGLPGDPDEQAAWMRRLVEARVSAVVIAAGPEAPEVTAPMLDVAEAAALPVLAASFSLEFSGLARIVVDSTLRSQRQRLSAGAHLFESYAAALREESTQEGRLARVGRRLGWRVGVCEARDGDPAAPTVGDHGAAAPLSVPVPGGRGDVLEVAPLRRGEVVDPLLAHHLAGLVAVDLERQARARDDERWVGEKLLEGLVSGALDLAATLPTLERRGLGGSLVALAVHAAGHTHLGLERLHHAPVLQGHPPLLLPDEDITLVAVALDDDAVITSLARAAGEQSCVGASEVLTPGVGVAEAVRQARLALALGQERGERLHRYATAEGCSLPSTLPQARALVARDLAAILDYDRDHGSDLLGTLETFLAHDGHAKETAQVLHVHRQTLVYRLSAVERLTGLKPSSTTGTTLFWTALRAGRAGDLLPRPPRTGPGPHPRAPVPDRDPR